MSENKISTKISGEVVSIPIELLRRYDRQIPRYTSYPTAPVWKPFTPADFSSALSRLDLVSPISIYLHVPFCEERCRFCGCSTIATRKKSVAADYVNTLATEIGIVSKRTAAKKIESIHFGGGTPTYLSHAQIGKVLSTLDAAFAKNNGEVSIEVDPRKVTREDVATLANLGFTRISFGVQDIDTNVQRAIGRECSFEKLAEVVDSARSSGFLGVNVDLIYGLPSQNSESFLRTLEQVVSVSPDRIACFNFAYLPKLLPHQSQLGRDLFPNPIDKFKIFTAAVEFLTGNGYQFVGLDHFAKKSDALSVAATNGTLTRNFQGYVPSGNSALLGVGLTSISEISGVFAQNSKKLIDYYRRVAAGEMATVRGLALCEDDIARQKIVSDIMCLGQCDAKNISVDGLSELESDGLIVRSGTRLKLTNLGRFFSRNVAAKFDAYLNGQTLFSRSV